MGGGVAPPNLYPPIFPLHGCKFSPSPSIMLSCPYPKPSETCQLTRGGLLEWSRGGGGEGVGRGWGVATAMMLPHPPLHPLYLFYHKSFFPSNVIYNFNVSCSKSGPNFSWLPYKLLKCP